MNLSGFAIDLGGTKIAAARIEDGIVVARQQVATSGGADLEGQLQSIAALLAEIGFQPGKPLGVAVAGRVDRDGNWHAVNVSTLSAITAAPLGKMIEGRFGGRVAVINDAAAAALAESRLGAGRGVHNFAYLTVSTGVGGGLVLAGRLLDSRNGLGGHVGFASSSSSQVPCGSGRFGTVESVAGGRAIAAAAGMADAKAVFEVNAHHPAIRRSAEAVSRLIADLTAILGLDVVAVGGSIGLAPGYLLQVLSALEREPALFRPLVMPAQLLSDSGLIGALLNCTEDSGRFAAVS